MRFLITILMALLICDSVVFAEETEAIQEINSEQNKAVVTVQKQPINEKSSQKQNLIGNWFCIVIQINGKIPYDKTGQQGG